MTGEHERIVRTIRDENGVTYKVQITQKGWDLLFPFSEMEKEFGEIDPGPE